MNLTDDCVRCNKCGNGFYIDSAEVDDDGKSYCPYCEATEENFSEAYKCKLCGDIYDEINITRVDDGSIICDDCIREFYTYDYREGEYVIDKSENEYLNYEYERSCISA